MIADIGSLVRETYNAITALQRQLEALENYLRNAQDEQRNLWRQVPRGEIREVQPLSSQIERLMQESPFRAASSDRAA